MATAVFVLCAFTSITCALLCGRGYRAGGSRLLLWSGLCFTGLAANNTLLVVDEVILTEIDLSVARAASQLAGIVVLLFGLIWDAGKAR